MTRKIETIIYLVRAAKQAEAAGNSTVNSVEKEYYYTAAQATLEKAWKQALEVTKAINAESERLANAAWSEKWKRSDA